MSYFGAASSAGGGGFRFNAPSSAIGSSSQLGGGPSGAVTLTTAAGSPPLTIQVLQKSSRPRLQMIMSQINNCKSKAGTVVKGSASQKQFNQQYSSVIGLLATAVKDVDEELYMAVELQNMIAKAGGGGSNATRIDPKKVPSSVSIHGLAKDLALYVTSAREVTLGIPYLEMIAKPAIQSVVEKETAHERNEKVNAAKDAKKERESRNAVDDGSKNALSVQLLQQHTNATQRPSGDYRQSPSLMPHSLVVGGLPSPLQRAVGGGRASGLEDLLPPPLALPGVVGGGASAPTSGGSALVYTVAPNVHENTALSQVIQPWLIPYPFSHGVKTDRVQAVRTAVARAQKASFAVQSFRANHPKKAAAVVDRIPQSVLQQYANHHQHGKHHHQHGKSPLLNPSTNYTPPPVPADVLLPYIIHYGSLTRSQCYELAPKILEICACPTAGEMLHKWEHREAIFDVLLNAPAAGTSTLGQISSINAQANPPTEAVRTSHGTMNNSGAHVSLAMRSGELGSYDNSQLYLGSPTLKPLHQTPPMRPMIPPPGSSGGADSNRGSGRFGSINKANANNSDFLTADLMTPMLLAGDEPIDGMAELSLSSFGPSSAHNSAFNAGHNNNGSFAAAGPERRRGFFPHRCSNVALSNKPLFSSAPAPTRPSPPLVPAGGKPSSFTVTNTTNNSRLSGGAAAPLGATGSGMVSTPTTSPTIAANPNFFGSNSGDKRPREGEDDFTKGNVRNMFAMSPLTFGADPSLASNPNNALGMKSPQPMKPIKGGLVPGLRSNSTQALQLSPAMAPRREGNGENTSTAPEPQPFMTISGRVMSCLLHFGVVTTELPMVVGGNQPKEKRHLKEHRHQQQKHHHHQLA